MKSNDQVQGVRMDGGTIFHDEIDLRRSPDITTGVLWVVIPFTTPELTLAAIRHAGACSDLDVHVALIDLQVVPFPCPIDQPPINNEYSQHRLQELFSESGVPGRAAVLYTRDWLEGFRRVLEPNSLVVMATKRRWWPTREMKLARALSKAGHQVMLLSVR
jgi:hypothetical protein